MSRRLVIRPAAESELSEAYRWYEAQRQGLGSEFLVSVEAALALIQRTLNYARSPTSRFAGR